VDDKEIIDQIRRVKFPARPESQSQELSQNAGDAKNETGN